MYFMIDPDLLQLEKMMVLIPRFTPPGSGLLVRITEEAPENAGHDWLMRETMRYIHDQSFLRRFEEYQTERMDNAMQYRGTRHRTFFERELQKRKNPSAAMLCALYLLTADCQLWMRMRMYVYGAGVRFHEVKLRGLSPDAYTLYMTAKDLYCGTKHITIRDLADKDIVSARLFELICEAMTIRRYGVAACDAGEKTGGIQ